MQRIQLFVKVVLDAEDEDRPQMLADEVCRQVQKVYGVRSAEAQNITVEKVEDETL